MFGDWSCIFPRYGEIITPHEKYTKLIPVSQYSMIKVPYLIAFWAGAGKLFGRSFGSLHRSDTPQ